jgi:hypothetical protein
LLGYILLYTGDPLVHPTSWYCSFAYSGEEETKRKQPEVIKADQNIRLFVAGIGQFDYLSTPAMRLSIGRPLTTGVTVCNYKDTLCPINWNP